MGTTLRAWKPTPEVQDVLRDANMWGGGHECSFSYSGVDALQKCFAATYPGKTRGWEANDQIDLMHFTAEETRAMADTMEREGATPDFSDLLRGSGGLTIIN
ncbi:hypothetical protein [Ruegeria sp. HKCCA4707]|uniref:hypothetical protein n=1 Tax=Ruegeria sp. HKCCA4707 TaxID=2682984 RepID=UPI001489A380|nr:hypothetical protein [Ruegeria sp. HKCCA4707]